VRLTFRDILPGSVVAEFDAYSAILRGYLFTQHKDDGSHSDVTVDNLTVNPDGEITFEPPTGTEDVRVVRVTRESYGMLLQTVNADGDNVAFPFYLNGGAVVRNILNITADGTTAGVNAGDINLLGSNGRIYEAAYASGMGYWTSYTPTWASAANPQPAIGTGTITGKYTRIGNTVHFKIQVAMGGTTSFGTGVWTFSLPVSGQFQFRALGAAAALDSGTNYRVGMTYLTAAGTCSVVFDSDTNTVQPTQPFVWASGDALYIEGHYDI
jgi:hypothetical protein